MYGYEVCDKLFAGPIEACDNSIIALPETFWPMLEKFLESDQVENSSLSMSACRALSQAIKSAGNSESINQNLGLPLDKFHIVSNS